MSIYVARINKDASGDFRAQVLRVEKDGFEQIHNGYKPRYFSTEKAAIKSTSSFIARQN